MRNSMGDKISYQRETSREERLGQAAAQKQKLWGRGSLTEDQKRAADKHAQMQRHGIHYPK